MKGIASLLSSATGNRRICFFFLLHCYFLFVVYFVRVLITTEQATLGCLLRLLPKPRSEKGEVRSEDFGCEGANTEGVASGSIPKRSDGEVLGQEKHAEQLRQER